MTTPIASFQWHLQRPLLTERVYAEGTLIESGRPGDRRFMLEVHLVRDEMRPIVPGEVIDPAVRTGVREYVGIVSADNEDCRKLAYLAPVEGTRLAYTLMHRLICDNPDAVQKFGDETLIDLIGEFAAAAAD